MLKALLNSWKSSDWALALDFLSPAFFEVVPTLGMSLLMSQLSRHYLNRALMQRTQEHWTPILPQVDAQLSWGESRSDQVLPASLAERQAIGQTLLRLYFAALLNPTPSYLDLRVDRFCFPSSRILWQPKPWIHQWDADFRLALLAIYEGYYDDQPQLFRQGLRALNLEHAEELFVRLFGNARQGEMEFSLRQFQGSFHQIFLSCKEHKTKLHPEFLALGLLLFSLYEFAERLAVPLNPRLAWDSMSSMQYTFGWAKQGAAG